MTVVKAVLLYGLETWVMSPHIERALGTFHHRVACILTVQQLGRLLDSRWVYPPLVEAVLKDV